MANKKIMFLPDDLVIEILEWLPIKSLVRFNCVSKPWSTLFRNPVFIKNHRRKQGSKGTMLLLRRRSPPPHFDGSEDILSFHDMDCPQTEVPPSLSITFLKDLLNLDKITPSFGVVGSCNGILCIYYCRRHILCNPSSQEFKLLPPCCPHGCAGKLVTMGFGFASYTNDFKIIVMHKLVDPSLLVVVHIYTSGNNSWRTIDDAPPVLPVTRFLGDGAFLNSAYHWIGRTCTSDNKKKILSLDINSEVFSLLELPDCLCQPDIPDAVPVLINERIGLVQCRQWYSPFEPFEVWVMNEYGIKESWTKKSVISPPPTARTLLPWKDEMIVQEPSYGLTPDLQRMTEGVRGVFFEQLNCQLTSVSLRTNMAKEFQVYGAQFSMRAIIHEESLVSLN